MLPHICREMSFEISDELVHIAYIFSQVCKCRSLYGDVYEQSTDAYKYTNNV